MTVGIFTGKGSHTIYKHSYKKGIVVVPNHELNSDIIKELTVY